MGYFCSLTMNNSIGRKALEMRFITSGQPLSSGCPLTYSIGGRQLFVFVTLENTIHTMYVHRDYLQFNIEYGTSYSLVIYHLPKKRPKTSYRKSTLSKSAKTSHVGMHLHRKTLPQKPMKQTTMHTTMHARSTHSSHIPKHKPSRAIPHNINQHATHSTKLTTLNLHFTKINTPTQTSPTRTCAHQHSQHSHKTSSHSTTKHNQSPYTNMTPPSMNH